MVLNFPSLDLELLEANLLRLPVVVVAVLLLKLLQILMVLIR